MTQDYKREKAMRKKELRQKGIKWGGIQETCAIFMDILLTTKSQKERDNLLNELFLLDEFARRGNYNLYVVRNNLRYFELHGNNKKELRKAAKKIINYFIRALKADLSTNPVILTPAEAYLEFYLLTWLAGEKVAYGLEGNTPQKKFVLGVTKAKFRSLERSLPDVDYFHSIA